MTLGVTLLITVAVFGGVAITTGALRRWLLRRALVDTPNERSSHSSPTPRGGGITVMAAILIVSLASVSLPTVVLGGALLLALISWIDDVRTLPVLPRILAQVVAVGAAILLTLPPAAVFPFPIPVTAPAVLICLGWVWFVNLYNFMDGIDGITGVETIAICVGIALVGALNPAAAWLVFPALTVAAAMAGFLVWNWHPAKIFLGDVGSVPIGYLCGFMLLALAASGEPAAALLIPSYYLGDATVTLIKRAMRREKVWQAHKEHFYQRAHQRGLDHAAVSKRIAAMNALLIACALCAQAGYAISALVVGYVSVAVFLAYLNGRWAKP